MHRMCRAVRDPVPAICAVVATLAAVAVIASHAVAATDRVYTIGNYPVEATAKNAVAAKRMAINDGRAAAFRSLLKRIVPVTAYQRLKSVKALDPSPFIKSVAVKSERSSQTRYVASLDYTFLANAVRAELKRRAVPFVDNPAPPTVLVPIYRAPPNAAASTAEMSARNGQSLWTGIWADLDLSNSVTPVRMRRPAKQLQADTVAQLRVGDFSGLRIVTGQYQNEQVLLAVAEPDLAAKRLSVVITGRDAVGAFRLVRRYRLDPADFAYALELAAVVSLGIVEGRWKAVKAPVTAGGYAAGPLQSVQIWVEFANLAEWRRHQQTLERLPGVEDLQTGGLSADGASVVLRYPGGGDQLRAALASQGVTLTPYNDTWILR